MDTMAEEGARLAPLCQPVNDRQQDFFEAPPTDDELQSLACISAVVPPKTLSGPQIIEV
jgi:hypothetical protein